MSKLAEILKHAFSMRRAEPFVLAPSLERLAVAAVERGLETPALVLAESLAPVSFLAGQATAAIAPFVRALSLGDAVPEIAEALEDRRSLQALANRIEQLAAARRGAA